MYEYSSNPLVRSVKLIFERCHDLDLLRCYDGSKMAPKLEALANEVGKAASDKLVRQTAEWIVATGDRLMYSPCSDIVERNYHEKRFSQCSLEVPTCLATLGLAASSDDGLSSSPPVGKTEQDAPSIPGEHAVRFYGSQYKRLHAAQMLKWKTTQWNEEAVDANRKAIKEQLQLMLREYCKVHPREDEENDDAVARGVNAGNALLASAEKQGESVENMAVRLWTTGGNVEIDHRELCSVLNQVIREDGKLPEGKQTDASNEYEKDASILLTAATSLICMIQHHLNASRRKGLSAPSIWPEGPSGVGDCNSAKKDTTFRGGGIPVAHIEFYQALAGTGRVYRIPGLLATSFKMSVAIGFMSRAKPDPMVLWTIKLKDREELGGGCNQVRDRISPISAAFQSRVSLPSV